jgi:hypothetical protein
MSATLPLQYDLMIYSGATLHREFRWKPDGITGQDFTGWHGRARIGSAQAALIELTDDNAGVQLSNAGQIVLAMTPDQTASLPTGVFAYQLDLIGTAGDVTRFLRGRLQVVTDVGPLGP